MVPANRVLFAALASLSLASGTKATDTFNRLEWKFGGDFRIREEWLYHVPTAQGPASNQDFYRFRTRLFAEAADPENWAIRVRLANETFEYKRPKASERYHFPDQLLLDNLYLELRNLWGGRINARIGRQDLNLGSDRIFGDGTPMDGSRTWFMDMIRITHRITPTLTAEYLAIHNNPTLDDALTIGRARGVPPYFNGNRPVLGIEGTSQDLAETGLGAYIIWEATPTLTTEFYGIWKHDSDRKNGPEKTTIPGRDVFTAGIRLLPRFTETLSAEFEGALQGGRTQASQPLFAYMAHAALKWEAPLTPGLRANLFAATTLLSGDDDTTDGRDTNWNPLWGRYPQISELLSAYHNSTYGICYLTNLIYPHIGGKLTLDSGHTLQAHTGYAFADQPDTLGGGTGRNLGWLTQFIITAPLIQKAEHHPFTLCARFHGEIWRSSDYFTDDEWAYFGRFEILLTF